jgi:hypothetical protein
MKWHLVHRHETPNAFDALGKDYEAKTQKTFEEKVLLEKRVQLLEMEFQQTEIKLIKERGEKLLESAEVEKLKKDMQKMAVALVIRDSLIKEKLNIELPSPFK